MLIKRLANRSSLNVVVARSMIYETGNPYNKRFQWKFRHSYKTEPLEHEHTRVRKPEDSVEYDSMFGATVRDWTNRIIPNFSLFQNRGHRVTDPVNLYVLPIWAVVGLANFQLAFAFKLFTAVPLVCLYTRIRNKVIDPEIPETHLRDMIYNHERLGELFKIETTNVLDYDAEYDKGFPDAKEFPEFSNKLFSTLSRTVQHGHAHVHWPLRLRRSRVRRDHETQRELSSSRRCP